MQIIGTRPHSTWRVPANWYVMKTRFPPGVDPTTGGPVCVVYDNTDEPAGFMIDCDPDSQTYRQAIRETRENPPRLLPEPKHSSYPILAQLLAELGLIRTPDPREKGPSGHSESENDPLVN